MQLTMTGEYAIRAMIHLAGLPSGTSVQIAEISRTWNVPEPFMCGACGDCDAAMKAAAHACGNRN